MIPAFRRLLPLALLPVAAFAQGDLSGTLTATAFLARAGEPARWGRLEFAPRWEAGDAWKFKAALRAGAWSRGPAGRTRAADPLERGEFQPALQIDDLEARRLWSGRLRTELRAGFLPLRWGRTDGFTPVDTLAPRDFTDLLDSRRPALPAVSLAWRGARGGLETILIPVFAPDRPPPGLLGAGGRWSAPLPARVDAVPGLPPLNFRYAVDPRDLPARTPREAEWAARWEWVGSRIEAALSVEQGRQKTARITPLATGFDPMANRAELTLRREWPRVRQYGLELLVPQGSLLWRAEGAWIAPRDGGDGRLLYALELEGQRGDWHAIAAWGGVRASGASSGGGSAALSGLATGADLSQGGLPGLLVSVRREVAGEWGGSATVIRGWRDHGWLVRGAVSLPRGDRLRLEAGVDLLGGPADSLYGAFRDEDRLRLAATWSF